MGGGHARDGEDRDREQNADGESRDHLQQEVRRLDGPGKGEFRITVGVEDAPIGSDAAFEGLPRLVEGLDDRVVDAHGIGAGYEVAYDRGLGERARHRVLAIKAGARPAELGDHDALARISLPQPVIDIDGMVDGERAGHAFPIGQNVHGEVVDGGSKLGVLQPNVRHLGRGHGDGDFALYPLNLGDELAHGLIRGVERIVAVQCLRPEDRLVADDDAFDVAVVLGERDRGFDLLFVLLLPFVDPDAERDAQTVFGGKRRNEVQAVADAIGPHRARIRSDSCEVRSDLGLGRTLDLAVLSRIDGREGDACERAIGIGRRDPLVQEKPRRRMKCGRKHDHNDDNDVAHILEISAKFDLPRPPTRHREACGPPLNFF